KLPLRLRASSFIAPSLLNAVLGNRAAPSGDVRGTTDQNVRGTAMGLSTITLLGMLCTPGQAPTDMTTWNSPSMTIPIDYNPRKKGEIKELLLYVSADQGQSWQQQGVAVPERDGFFNFNAPADGVYWFNMVVVDKAGRRE